MNTICLYFEVHQPCYLRRYRFFDIGNDHYYYDDNANESNIKNLAEKCYRPATQMLLDMIKESGNEFHVSFSISGVTLDLLERYAPEVIDKFKELSSTGCVEFLGETYAHSLSSLNGDNEFELQVKEHSEKIYNLFGQKPKVLRNTELIYSNGIGLRALQMGFAGMITEGDKRFMGWHSPNYVYCCSSDPRLKLLTRNSNLSNDVTFRFSDWGWDQYPLTAEKFVDWIASSPKEEQVTCIFMNLETIGHLQNAGTGIFDFFRAIPKFAAEKGLKFMNPSEIFAKTKPIDQLRFDNPISWGDAERDVTAWLGNEIQREAFEKVSQLNEKVRISQNKALLQDWYRLQSCDNFYYMSTKHFSNGPAHNIPFDSPFDAFINYMNVLNDFRDRVNEEFPENIDMKEFERMRNLISKQEEEIRKLKAEHGGAEEKTKTEAPVKPKRASARKKS